MIAAVKPEFQLTVDEATESCSDNDNEHDSSNAKCQKSQTFSKRQRDQQQQPSALVTKTYSFRRMLSFRGSLRGGRVGGRSSSSFEEGTSSPNLQPHHRYVHKSDCITICHASYVHTYEAHFIYGPAGIGRKF